MLQPNCGLSIQLFGAKGAEDSDIRLPVALGSSKTDQLPRLLLSALLASRRNFFVYLTEFLSVIKMSYSILS